MKHYWSFELKQWVPNPSSYGTGTFIPSLARRAAKDHDGAIEFTIVQTQKFYQVIKEISE